jgi:Rieske Fe-S protein
MATRSSARKEITLWKESEMSQSREPLCCPCPTGAAAAEQHGDRPNPERRTLLKAAALTAAASALPGAVAHDVLAADTAASKARPQEGDLFVYAGGEKDGKVITPADVPLGGPQVLAWAKDPETDTVRDGSRLNQVLLLRLDPASFDEETRQHATPDGILAYAATCTHAQCPVTGWRAETKRLHCPCHDSEYEPQHDGNVVAGPAPRRLPALPVKIGDEGALIVAGGFTARVGAHPA